VSRKKEKDEIHTVSNNEWVKVRRRGKMNIQRGKKKLKINTF